MKKYIALIAAFIIIFQAFFSTTVFAAKDYILKTEDYGDIRDTMSDTWVAIDDLGREVSTGDTVRDVQEEKHVLMFFALVVDRAKYIELVYESTPIVYHLLYCKRPCACYGWCVFGKL